MPSSEPVINIESLIAPIPGDNPAGENTQYTGLYDQLREARRQDEDLQQGVWKRELKTADWDQVIELATGALTTKTKDLQIVAWMTEALIKEYGFVGLRDGLKVMRSLHELYWEYVYPEIDEGDLEARANSLAWLDRQSAPSLREVALTNGAGGPDYSFIHWEESQLFDVQENFDNLDYNEQERLQALKAQAEAENKVTSGQWTKAKNLSKRAFYEEVFAVLNECQDEFTGLDRVMDEKFGRETPGLNTLKKTLDEIRTLIEKIVKEKRVLEPDEVAIPEADAAGNGAAGSEGGVYEAGVAGTSGPIRSRQDALRRLGEVAGYFRAAEPHSPVTYLVERAIKWGSMPLENWLEEVIKDEGVLSHLRETLGLKKPESGSSFE